MFCYLKTSTRVSKLHFLGPESCRMSVRETITIQIRKSTLRNMPFMDGKITEDWKV